MRSKFFSLIELLVVIAVIAILMTMLLPALRKAKMVAGGAVCLNNLKQLHAATMNYLEDNDQLFPHCGGGGNTWQRFLAYRTGQNYVDNYDIFLCPLDKDPEMLTVIGANSYATNYYTAQDEVNINQSRSFKHWVKSKKLTKKILYIDSFNYSTVSTGHASSLMTSAARHNLKLNIVSMAGNANKVGQDYVSEVTNWTIRDE